MPFDAFSFNCPPGGQFHDMKPSSGWTVSYRETTVLALCGAHRVAADRKSVEVEAQRVHDEAASRQSGPAPQAPLSPEAQASHERLKKLRSALKRRAS